MMDQVAAAIWLGVGVYLAVGAAVWLWLIFGALARLDPLAAAAPLRVKLMITPGLVALWPLVLRRVAGARAPEDVG